MSGNTDLRPKSRLFGRMDNAQQVRISGHLWGKKKGQRYETGKNREEVRDIKG